MNRNWQQELYNGIKAARLGREVLLKYWGKLEKVEEKFQEGLVSEADRESEQVIFQELRKFFPNDEMIGEESTASVGDLRKNQVDKKTGSWIVDPLDGTTNYIHRLPIYCISMGYRWQGKMQMAIVDVPALGETYTAIRGHGAYVNGRKLAVSSTPDLRRSLLATGFFHENEVNLQEQLQIFSKIVRQVRGVRRAGAAAYDLCQVARGVFDGYWERDIKPWDSAAGILLVEEAGGRVTTYTGQDYNPFANSIVAGNAHIVGKILEQMFGLVNKESD